MPKPSGGEIFLRRVTMLTIFLSKSFKPEKGHHVHMLDFPLRVRVVLRPEDDKLAEMVRTQDGPVASEVIKVVHDDGNEEVEHQEGTDDEEADEVDVGKVAPTALRFSSIVGLKEKFQN